MTRSAVRSAGFVSIALSVVAAAAASTYRGVGLTLTVVAMPWIPTLAAAIPDGPTRWWVVRVIRVARIESTVVVTTALLFGSFARTGDTPLRYLLKDVVVGLGSVVTTTARIGDHPAATAANASWLPAATATVAIISVELIVRSAARADACAAAASLVAMLLAGTQVVSPATGSTAVLLGVVVVLCVCGAVTTAPLRRSVNAATVAIWIAVGSCAAIATAAVPHRTTPSRFMPRPPEPKRPIRDPLAMISQRLAHPAVEVFRARPSAPVTRWRLAVLDVVDDGEWTFREHLKAVRRPIDRDPADPPPSGFASADVRLVVGEQARPALVPGFLPAPTRPRRLDDMSSVYVEPVTGAVYADTADDDTYHVTWEVRPQPSDISDRSLFIDVRTPAPTIPETIARIARDVVAGKERTVDGALRIAAYLHRTCRLVSSPVAGHDLAHIEAFLTTTHTGTSEQFAVAFADLAAASGIPVRVVVGFRQPLSHDPGGWYVVKNGDVAAWAEIRVAGVGWYPIDPTPGSTSGTTAPVPHPTPTPSVSASPSHASASPPPTTSTPMPATTPPVVPPPGRPLRWVTAAVVLVACVAAAAVPAGKAVRVRRRRRRGGRAGVVAAWHTVLDALTDQRMLAGHTPTPTETAAVIVSSIPASAADAAALARHADRALWSSARQGGDVVATAWQASDDIRRALVGRSVRARWRAWFATASLRQATAHSGMTHRGSTRRH